MTRFFSTSTFKAALLRVPFFVAFCILLNGCGDLGEDPVLSDAHFSRTFRYYYEEECRFDDEGMYDCARITTLSPAYVVRIRVDGFGNATLNLDGTEFVFEEGAFAEGRDRFGGYFHFYEVDSELTLYKDGSEMIIWDLESGFATIYSYEM